MLQSMGKCIGEENENPFQCSCLENLRDRGAWWAAVYGVAQSRTSTRIAGDLGSIPGSGRSPGEWHPTPVSLPGKFHGWRSLVGYSPWGRKESDMTEQLHLMGAKMSSLCRL